MGNQGAAFIHSIQSLPLDTQGAAFIHSIQSLSSDFQGPAFIHTIEAKYNNIRSKQLLANTFDGTEQGRAPFGDDLFNAELSLTAFSDDAISGSKITDATLTESKISGTIDGSKIADVTLTEAKISGTIDGSKIADATLTEAKISGTIDGSKIADATLTEAKISGTISGTKITDATLTEAKISGTISGTKITDTTLTEAKISGTISGSKITNATITETQLSGSITGTGLVGGSGSVIALELATGTVAYSGSHVSTHTVSTLQITGTPNSGNDPVNKTYADSIGGSTSIGVKGMVVKYATDDTLTISSGKCRSSNDSTNIVLSAEITVDVTLGNAALGNDQKVITGTGSSNGSGIVTGSGTSFLTAWPTYSITGTTAISSTIATGIGTKYLSELSVGDLIGSSSVGYTRVNSIASDISATVNVTTNYGTQSVNRLESSTLKIGIGQFTTIKKINSDTQVIVNEELTSQSGATLTIGGDSKDTIAASGFGEKYSYIWIIEGSSGTTGLISTQRTALINPPTGYINSERRVGTIKRTDGIAFSKVYYVDNSLSSRWAYYEEAETNFSLLLAGSSTTWAELSANAFAPPTATVLGLSSIITGSSGSVNLYMRARNLGSSAVTRPRRAKSVSTSTDSISVDQPCDGSQQIDYVISAGTASVDIYLYGYLDEL